MKTSGLRIFVDFFSPMLEVLVGIVGAGVGEEKVPATPVEVLTGGGGGTAIVAPMEGLTGGSDGTGV